MGFGVVCISSEDGSGAADASLAVSQALGFRLINEDILARAAVEAGVDQSVVADAERRKSFLAKLLEGAGPAAMAASAGMVLPEDAGWGADGKQLRDFIRLAIEDTAAAGNAVIVAHAASLALAGRSDVLRVLITASPETRRRRLAESLGVDDKEAARTLKRSDAGRADYLKRFYGIDAERSTHYDLVINTDKIGPQEAAKVIVGVMA